MIKAMGTDFPYAKVTKNNPFITIKVFGIDLKDFPDTGIYGETIMVTRAGEISNIVYNSVERNLDAQVFVFKVDFNFLDKFGGRYLVEFTYNGTYVGKVSIIYDKPKIAIEAL